MFKTFAALFSIAFIACPAASSAASLTVKISKLQNDSGIVRLCLFSEKASKADAFPDCTAGAPLKLSDGKIGGGQATVMFKDVPEGTYAVAMFHDANGDGKLNMKALFGIGPDIPGEGIGISNNPTLFGKPTFDEARFPVRGDTAITVDAKYF